MLWTGSEHRLSHITITTYLLIIKYHLCILFPFGSHIYTLKISFPRHLKVGKCLFLNSQPYVLSLGNYLQ